MGRVGTRVSRSAAFQFVESRNASLPVGTHLATTAGSSGTSQHRPVHIWRLLLHRLQTAGFPRSAALERGSVLVFGSSRAPYWVVDTVFVVGDYVDHTSTDVESLLAGRVCQCYRDVTLTLTCKGSEPSISRRWYRGATYDEPIEGMYSFFPCLPAEQNTPFPRPHIELPRQYFTPGLAQGAKGCALNANPLPSSTIKALWDSIAEQVLSQGLLLGVAARTPIGAEW